MSRIFDLGNPGPSQGYSAAAGPTASVGAAPSVLTSFALVSLDFSGSTDPAGGGLTYSATMDVKPTSSASTLVDSTTSTPDFTPDKIGTYSGVLTVTDINGRTDTSRWFREVRSALSVSIAAVSDQLDLSAATLDSTVTGGISPYTYAWTVNGATTGLSSSTAADPTFTPTAAGTPTAVVTVTDAAGQTAKASVTWRVGNAAGWVCVWSTSGITDHDHKVTTTKTHSGVDLEGYPGATWPTFAWASGTLTIDTTAGTGGGLTVRIGQALTAPRADKEIAFIYGVGADLTANSDGLYAAYSQYANTCSVELKRVSGVQKISTGSNLSAESERNTAGGLQGRIAGMILNRGRTGFKPLYSASAWSGVTGPEPDSMTNGGGTPSGWHSACSIANADSADDFIPDGSPDMDWIWMVPREANGRQYTIPGIAIWVRHL